MAEVLVRTLLLTPCNVLYLIARWIWIKQLSKQDPSFFIPTWLTQVVMRTLTLIQNTADHYKEDEGYVLRIDGDKEQGGRSKGDTVSLRYKSRGQK